MKLFIDVDGVIFGWYGAPVILQLRPFVSSFLSWAQDNYDCWWLTAWSEAEVQNLMSSLYEPATRISYAKWNSHKREGIEIVLQHSPDNDFFWLEDEPFGSDYHWLLETNQQDKLILVKPSGEHGLEFAIEDLCERSKVAIPHFME